jgi:hypothetical protein
VRILLSAILIASLTSCATVDDAKEVAPIKEAPKSETAKSAKEILKKPIVEDVVYKTTDRLDPQELKDLLSSVGFKGNRLKQAWAVVMKESTGRPMAHNKNSKTGDNSYGLFQINMIGDLGPARLKKYGLSNNKDLFNPLTNAKIAYKMSQGGKNWSAWNGITGSTLKWMKDFPN